MLVAMGILAERYHLPMFQINPRTGEFLAVYGNVPCAEVQQPMLARQSVLLHGGDILRCENEEIPLTRELTEAIDSLREICRSDRGLLNRTAAFFNSLTEHTAGLSASVAIDVSPTVRCSLIRLHDAGLLQELCFRDGGLSYTFCSPLAKRLLTKAGLPLEQMVRLAAEEAGTFTEVCQGIVLDWDGVTSELPAAETRNEVDVLLMRGTVPVFVSCKNGDVKKEALYELDVLAQRFGGKYAKKALVCAGLSGAQKADAALRCRASDMGITLIEDVYQMTSKELAEAIGRLG